MFRRLTFPVAARIHLMDDLAPAFQR
jgi:hypothetical protein